MPIFKPRFVTFAFMPCKYKLLNILLLCVCNVFGQNVFQKSYQSALSSVNYPKDDITSINVLPNGTILTTGTSQGLAGHNTVATLSTLSADGTLQSTTAYTTGIVTRFRDSYLAPSGSMFLAATVTRGDTAQSQTDMALVKLLPNGQVDWTTRFGNSGFDYGYAVAPCPDGSIVITGWFFVDEPNVLNYDVFVAKIGQNGDTLFIGAYGTPANEFTYDVTVSETGAILLTSRSDDNIMLTKLAPNGTLLWSKTYGPGLARKVIATPTGYVMAGDKADPSTPFGITDPFILKVDTNGNMMLYKTYYGPDYDYLSDIKPTPDGGFVLCGTTQSFALGVSDMYLIKCDALGQIQWSKAYGGYEYDEGQTVTHTPTGYLVGGYQSSFNNSQGLVYAAYLVATDSLGFSASCYDFETNTVLINNEVDFVNKTLTLRDKVSSDSITITPASYNLTTTLICPLGLEEDISSTISVYPNPANDFITLELPNGSAKQIGIYTPTGQLVFTSSNTSFSVAQLPAGVYFIKAIVDNRVVVKPFIKQ